MKRMLKPKITQGESKAHLLLSLDQPRESLYLCDPSDPASILSWSAASRCGTSDNGAVWCSELIKEGEKKNTCVLFVAGLLLTE